MTLPMQSSRARSDDSVDVAMSISVTDPRTLVGGSVMDLNVLAIVAGAIVAFLLSGAWYGVLGGQLAQLHEAYARQSHPAATTMVVELVRNAVVAVVIAGLADQIGIDAAPLSLRRRGAGGTTQ